MYRLIALLIVSSFLISGYSGISRRTVTDNEIASYRDKISDLPAATYESYWVQPGNKKEECKLRMEGYSYDGQEISKLEPGQISWDGDCKDGKTDGLGKIFVNADGVDWYEIAYHNLGITDSYFYRRLVSSNEVYFGAYIQFDGKTESLLNHASLDPDGNIEFINASYKFDQKNSIKEGILNKKYSNGTGKFTGLDGNKLFFGTREFYNSNNEQYATQWGYANLTTDNPESYVILKNRNGLQYLYYEHGTLKENVHLPQTYIDTLMKVYELATNSAMQASNAGRIALAMKNKYELSHKESDAISSPDVGSPHQVFTGTGFFVSDDGYLLTNSHVVAGASQLSIILHGEEIEASLIEQDKSNDIALLKVDKSVKGLAIELKNKTEKGAEIAVFGYPNIGLQGNELKITFGYVNANSGVQGDTRYFQISSPIQPGNPGSPMVNEQGVVIGMASASLNQSAAVEATRTLAQNVNYAVKIAYALPMLINHDVAYNEPINGRELSKTDLAETISGSVALVVAKL